MSKTAPARQDNRLKGILFMLAAMLTLSFVNVLAKDTVGRYPLTQVTFFRTFFALIPCVFLLIPAGGLRALKTKNTPRHLICGLAGTVAITCLFGSLKFMPLADAITLHFSSILFLTTFSGLFLKEPVGPHRWAAILVGFLGVVIIARPTGQVVGIGAMMALLFAFFDAFIMMNARMLTASDHTGTVVFYFSALVALFSGLTLPFFWEMPTLVDAFMLVGVGLGGGLGQIFLTFAYRHAPAGTVAPMIYSALIWATFFGYVIWGEIPDQILLGGASLIVLSGLYIIYRETRLNAAVTATAPQVLTPREK